MQYQQAAATEVLRPAPPPYPVYEYAENSPSSASDSHTFTYPVTAISHQQQQELDAFPSYQQQQQQHQQPGVLISQQHQVKTQWQTLDPTPLFSDVKTEVKLEEESGVIPPAGQDSSAILDLDTNRLLFNNRAQDFQQQQQPWVMVPAGAGSAEHQAWQAPPCDSTSVLLQQRHHQSQQPPHHVTLWQMHQQQHQQQHGFTVFETSVPPEDPWAPVSPNGGMAARGVGGAGGNPGGIDDKRARPYHCEVCDKYFIRKGHLNRHLSTSAHRSRLNGDSEGGALEVPPKGSPGAIGPVGGVGGTTVMVPSPLQLPSLHSQQQHLIAVESDVHHQHQQRVPEFAPLGFRPLQQNLTNAEPATVFVRSHDNSSGAFVVEPLDTSDLLLDDEHNNDSEFVVLESDQYYMHHLPHPPSSASPPLSSGPAAHHHHHQAFVDDFSSSSSSPTSSPQSSSDTTVSSSSKPRRFQCPVCQKKSSTEAIHEEHMAAHKGEKPFKCNQCPKQFGHKTDLRRHLCLHSGLKPFACPVCDKRFIRKDHMNKHCEVHNRDRAGLPGIGLPPGAAAAGSTPELVSGCF